nr:MAG TPA: hypothetical protein [Bacteriophage sp.]DAJ19970.1 MAG TPA: hypothetical protein [Myoviridae sp. ctiIS8]DAK50278.1 MAG TPA: hypothetical protein [Caudoviricetes sp.]DAE77661.1 MAG TPA: hypothetical protein [Bacteriophage sp.]DAI63822.1 MAG TPA: hypothetical protein [Bacteriophage sp.]
MERGLFPSFANHLKSGKYETKIRYIRQNTACNG